MKKKVNFLLFILVILGFFSCHKVQNDRIISLNNHEFTFELPVGYKAMSDTSGFVNLMKKANNNFIFFALTEREKDNYMIAVSRYKYSTKTPIEYAFMESIKTYSSSPNNNQKNELADFGIIHEDDEYLRYKVSVSQDSIYSIMFYFMKNDCSDELYEIKLGCKKKDFDKSFVQLKEAARTAKF